MRTWFIAALVGCSRDGARPHHTATEAPGGFETGVPGSTSDAPPPSEIALEAELIEVTAPEDPWVAGLVANSPFPPGSTVQFYVSRATSPDDLGSGLVQGLHPDIYTDDDPSAPTEDATVTGDFDWELVPGDVPGSYVLTAYAASGFHYIEGSYARFLSDAVGPWEGEAEVFQPASAIVAVPGSLLAGSSLTLEYGNQGFASAVGMVIDATGVVTWSNEPDSIAALFQANDVEAGSLTFPAEAFATPGDYVMGLAACTRTSSVDLDDLDTALSAVRAGRMRFWKVSVQ